MSECNKQAGLNDAYTNDENEGNPLVYIRPTNVVGEPSAGGVQAGLRKGAWPKGYPKISIFPRKDSDSRIPDSGAPSGFI